MENKEILEMINQLDKQDFELSSDIKLLYDEIKNIEGSFDISGVEKEIETLKESISSIELQKGDKGDKGDKGKDGKDGKNGKDGTNGKDGLNGRDGIDGLNGKDGSPDTPEQIIEKINTLENVIDIKTIKDFPKIEGTEDIKRQVDTIGNQVLRLLSKQQQSSGGGTWGSITGTLSNQTDLQNALNLKYDASNPAGYITASSIPTNISAFTNDVGYITSSALSGYTPTSRTITINGATQDLSSNRTWTISVPTKTSDLTNDSGFITSSALSGYLQNNVGIAGGTTLIGGTASGNNLTLVSTSNATKGKILFGTSAAYDEVNNRLGIGTTNPVGVLDIYKSDNANPLLMRIWNGGSGGAKLRFVAEAGGTAQHQWTTDIYLAAIAANNTIGMQFRVGLNATEAALDASTRMTITTNGKVGIGTTTPTALLMLAAGTATANTAPLKFTSGTNLATPEAGAIEYNNTFHVTNSDATRRHVVTAPNTTKVTASAPYTNDGYITINIGGTDFKVMTTA